MDEKIPELAEKVITLAQNSVSVNLRYMQNAVVMLKNKTYGGTVATDGKHFFYNPVHILRTYKKHPNYPQRLFVHTLLHCIFRHCFVKKSVDSQLWDICCDITVESIINELGICDIKLESKKTVESFFNKLGRFGIMRKSIIAKFDKRDNTVESDLIVFRICDIPLSVLQNAVLNEIREKAGVITALNLYEYFVCNTPSEMELEALQELFCFDDHSFWDRKKEKKIKYSDDENSENQSGDCSDSKNQKDSGAGSNGENSESQSGESSDSKKQKDSSTGSNDKNSENQSGEDKGGENPDDSDEGANDEKSENDSESRMLEEYKSALAQKWHDISERIQMDLDAFSGMATGGGGLLSQNLEKLNREEYDYMTFLREFSVLTEVIKVSEDEFDYNFYTYGMNMYGNMPLIEPLEYKDDKQVHEFVIAIDTSGSVSGNIVQAFVQKTYNILKQSECFSDRINVHIIQCDAKIQEDAKITSQEEFDEYIKKMTVKGFGGTDFRPVFSYVNKLAEQGEFHDLRGLIYLTDGFGAFPALPPKYKTAFILWDDSCLNNVPQWAMSMVIGKDEI